MRWARTESTIWQDQKHRELSPLGQRFYHYLDSAPVSNCVGIYKLIPGYAMADLGCTRDEFNKWMVEVEEKGFARWDPDNEVVLLCRFIAENPITNSKHLKAAVKCLRALPATSLLAELGRIIESIPVHKLETKDGGKLESMKGLLIALSKVYRYHPVTATAADTGESTMSEEEEDVGYDEETGSIYDKKTGDYIF